jgi:L-amino acid N-acyltransferase
MPWRAPGSQLGAPRFRAGGCPAPPGRPGTVSAVLLRLARPADAEAIRGIYNAEVTGSSVTFDLRPRSLEEQVEWLEARSGAFAVVVAEDDDEVVGFAALSPYRDRPAYSTTVEDSVYIRHDRRGTGLGRALLTELIEVAERQGFHTVMARIVGHHSASIELHRSLGFDVVGVEREVGRKFGKWLDVVLMQRML